MPFKYTGKKENYCMLGGHFHMGRKSKYSAAFKLIIIREAETSGIIRTSKKYSLADHTIRTWKLIYKYQGIQGLEPMRSNNTYSSEYKASLVEEYQKSDENTEKFAIQHMLRSLYPTKTMYYFMV